MHLIRYLPFPEPEFSYWDSNILGSSKLEGNIKIQFQDIKACIGYNDGKEQHFCANSALNVKQCPYCSFRDISRVYTRMDMRGFEHLEQEIKNRPYSLYLAYFGRDVIKCGVCREERLLTRLKEQGALYYIHLMDFNNADDCYSMEKLLQHNFGLKNAVRNSTKLKVINEVKPELLNNTLDEIKNTSPFCDFVIPKTKVQNIDYNLPTQFNISNDSIDGEVLGSRGSFLFFKNNGENFAIDLKKKVGEYFKFF